MLSRSLRLIGAALVWAILGCAASPAGAESYVYDALGRVVSVTTDDNRVIIYSYDAAGNRTQVAVQSASTLQIPTNLSSPIYGKTYSQTLTVTGTSAPVAFEVTQGALPTGITLNGISGTVSGTTTVVGNFQFTITAVDPSLLNGSKSFNWTVVGPPTFPLTSLPTPIYGKAYSQSLNVTGGTAPVTFAVSSGTLPVGITLMASSGALTGSTTATGSFSFTITAIDANGVASTQSYTWLVIGPPKFTTTSVPTPVYGRAYAQPLGVTGGAAPLTFGVSSGALPTGLVIAPVYSASGSPNPVLQGTTTSTGNFSFAVSATDANGLVGSQAYSFTIQPPPSIATTSLPVPIITKAYSQTVSTSGGTAPITLSISPGPMSPPQIGTLPPGLTIANGAISGTTALAASPTATTTGYSFQVVATDANGLQAKQAFNWNIVGPPGFSLASYPIPSVGVAYTSVVNGVGGSGALSFALSAGALPPGLSFAQPQAAPYNGRVGLISGTPTAGGIYNFTLTVTDSTGVSSSQAISWNVISPPVVTPASFSIPWNQSSNIAATVANSYTGFNLVTKPLNGTLVINGKSLTYTPNTNYFGVDSFVINAFGPGGTSASATLSLNIIPPAPTLTPIPPLTVPFQTPTSFTYVSDLTVTNFSISKQPTNGVVSFKGPTLTGQNQQSTIFTYSPTGTYSGPDTFSIVATSAGGSSAPGTVAVTVLVPAPTAGFMALTVPYNTVTSVGLNVGGTYTSVTAKTSPSHGTVSIVGAKATYTPNSGYFGADNFSYQAVGPGGPSATANVAITVQNQPAPVISAYALTLPWNSTAALTPTVVGSYTSFNIVTQPSHGSVTGSGVNLSYAPAVNFAGADSLALAPVGPGGTGPTVTIPITVQAPPPQFSGGGSIVTHLNTPSSLTYPTSPTVTSFAVVTQPGHGSASVSGATVTYTPTSGYSGADSFTVTASGPGGTSAPVTVSVTVFPPAPVASAFAMSVTYNTPATANLALSGSYQSAQIVTQAKNGIASISGAAVTYTPTTAYSGADSFTYSATGTGGTSPAATVSVMVGKPPPPSIAAYSQTVPWNTGSYITPVVAGVFTSYAVTTQPTHGTATASGQSIVYTPVTNYAGPDTFSVAATGPGGTGSSGTISITVQAPAPTLPTFAPLTVNYNSPAQFSYASGPTITSFNSSTLPSHGNLAISSTTITNGQGSTIFSYTPNSGFSGTDSFAVVAVGPGGTSAPASVSVTVLPLAPVANPMSMQVAYGVATTASLAPTGNFTSVQISTNPSHGAATLSGTSVTYTPVIGFYGADSFSYVAVGPTGSSSPATVTVTVAAPPPPTLTLPSLSVAYNTPNSFNYFANSATTSLKVYASPTHGTLVVGATNFTNSGQGTTVITYTPSSGFSGTDSFALQAVGPSGTSTPAQVSVGVAPPALSLGSLSVAFNTPSSFTYYTQAGTITALQVSAMPTHGTVAVGTTTTTASGQGATVVTYKPNSGYAGADSFSLLAVGPGGSSPPATETVTVLAAPSAGNLSLNAAWNAPIAISLVATSAYSSFSVSTQPLHGTVTISGNTATYTPNAGFYGSDSFAYVANYPGGSGAPGTVAISVVAPTPTVSNLSLSTNYLTPVSSPIPTSGPYSTISIDAQPAHGAANINGNVVTYTPAAGFAGSDWFSYYANGPGGKSFDGSATITVAVPPVPTAGNVSPPSVAYGGTASISLAPGGAYSSLNVASPPSHGTASIAGVIATYTPSAGYTGADSFTYTATGPGGTSAPATVALTVAAPLSGPPPTIYASVPYPGGNPATINISLYSPNYSNYSVLTYPPNGLLQVINSSLVSYMPKGLSL